MLDQSAGPYLEGHQAPWDMKLPCVLYSPCCLLPNCLYMLSAAMLSDWFSGTQKTGFNVLFLRALISGAHWGGHGKSSIFKAVSRAADRRKTAPKATEKHLKMKPQNHEQSAGPCLQGAPRLRG